MSLQPGDLVECVDITTRPWMSPNLFAGASLGAMFRVRAAGVINYGI